VTFNSGRDEFGRSGYSLIYAKDALNVSLCGKGKIDGQGQAFWLIPSHPDKWIEAKFPRPCPMIEFDTCQDVKVQDLYFTNPVAWCFNLHNSDRIIVHAITINDGATTPNSDGIDISGCHDVMISDSYIVTGDDGIVINSVYRDVKHVTVTNCVLRSNCSALRVGWEDNAYDIRQVTFSNCTIFGSSRGFSMYFPGGGTVVEDVAVSNIVFDSNTAVMFPRPIHIDLRKGRKVSLPNKIRNVSISNFIARTQGRILLTAEKGCMLENITIRDIQLFYPYIEDIRSIAAKASSAQFSNNNPEAREAQAAIVAENIDGLIIDGLSITWPGNSVPEEWQIKVKRENGSVEKLHYPKFDDPTPIDFSVIWGRNLQNSFIHAPFVKPSSNKVETFDIKDSTVKIAN
jgi:hypothetical protein